MRTPPVLATTRNLPFPTGEEIGEGGDVGVDDDGIARPLAAKVPGERAALAEPDGNATTSWAEVAIIRCVDRELPSHTQDCLFVEGDELPGFFEPTGGHPSPSLLLPCHAAIRWVVR